jgi:hypothetical protein
MMTKRKIKRVIEAKNDDSQKSSIWNIGSILYNIFIYVDRKDIIEFSTVCKKWNDIISPIIHKTIRLHRICEDTVGFLFKRSNQAAYIDSEVAECISKNAKHAYLVKELNFYYNLKPRRAIEFFQTFRFISNLSIGNCAMSQEQFLGMLSPLTQLQELIIRGLRIKNSFRTRSYKEAVQLPSTLRKLSLDVSLIDNPELFVQTINSHANLIEFSYSSETSEFLEPFYKPYPSLISFEYTNQQLESPQYLIKIFEQNPQIVKLKLSLRYWRSQDIDNRDNYLINLEEIDLIQYGFDNNDYPGFNFKFSQPTKIKKFKLQQIKLSNFSLNSILVNCSELEELDLRPYVRCKQVNSISFINPYIFTKIKKIIINCSDLSEGAFGSLLFSCPFLNELTITMPYRWNEAIQSICDKCANLVRLNIYPSFEMQEQESLTFYQEFYKADLFIGNPKCKPTLTHLSLSRFKAVDSKASYFKNFEKLKSIKYTKQNYSFPLWQIQNRDIDIDLWPGYIIFKKDSEGACDIEFKRL